MHLFVISFWKAVIVKWNHLIAMSVNTIDFTRCRRDQNSAVK